VLTCRDFISLVVDRVCGQARGQNSAVTCFYLEFAVQKEQSATAMLGSLLKRIVGGMEAIPEDISRALQGQKKAIGGWGPQPLDVVKMLQTIISSQTTFVCIGALDECAVVNRVKIFDSLKQILEKSSGTRVFITGRPHIHAEIERCLGEKVKNVSLCPNKEGIIRYLCIRLGEDETPDAIDKSLVADILEMIPQNVSEMYSHSAKVFVIQDMSLIAPLLSGQFLWVDARPASQPCNPVKSPQSIVSM